MRCPKCNVEMDEIEPGYWVCPVCGGIIYMTAGDDSDEEEY